MASRTIKSKTLTRLFSLDRAAVNEEARTVSLAFSSEQPVERWFGDEVLDHSPGAVDLGRLNDGGALLVDHNPRDQVGVVEKASVDADKVGRAMVRFGNSQRAQEIFRDVLDGIRTKISVGYRINEMVLDRKDEDKETYRATRWTPLEVSFVSIPADASVGVGRGLDEEHEIVVRGVEMDPVDKKPETPKEERDMPENIDIQAVQAETRKTELARVREINALGEKCGCVEDARKFVEEGKSAEDFRSFILESKWKPAGKVREVVENPELGLTDKEKKDYSFLRAMHAAATGDWSQAGFERECSAAAEKKLNGGMRGSFVIPHDILVARDYLSIGLTNHTGEKTVATDLLAGSFIEMLRNRMVMRSMGARVLSGLVGDIAIPRMTGGATAYWLTEDQDTTGSIQAFDQVSLTPKTVSCMTEVTRKLLMQSSLDVEGLVRSDLATTIALELDRVAINGSGSNGQPKGILNVTGIGSVAGGDNGLAPAWSHLVDLETEVAVDNADVGTMSYLTNTKVRGKLKKTFINTTGGDTPLWGNSKDAALNGYPAYVTNQVPSTLTKGTSTAKCSAILFGNWSDLLVGMWGGLDVLVDPYSGSKSGRIRIVMFQDCDLAVRHPESFAAMKDALTA